MHDPLVVAFEIRRPWPRRDSYTPKNAPRWSARGCFWMLAGRRYYWPSFITVWHVEPGGQDSGEVCKHYRRDEQPDGTRKTTYLRGWRWHVHHWRIQISPLQSLRRWALTRCAWCNGRSTKTNPVDNSHQWDGPRGRWWKGESGLYHRDCSTVASTRFRCSCEHPATGSFQYAKCQTCGMPTGGRSDLRREADRILIEEVPEGAAPTREVMNLVRNLWDVDRAQREADA